MAKGRSDADARYLGEPRTAQPEPAGPEPAGPLPAGPCEEGPPQRLLPPRSRVPVALAAGFGVLMCATQNGYGLAGDEYFFLAAGQHLSWGYADQPALVAVLARLADTVAPDSRVVLRLPMVLAVCVGIVMCAVIARECGGRRGAQVLAAATFALSPYALSYSRYVTTDAIDMAMWACVTWLLARWIRTRQDRLWWAMAAATVVALAGKYLIVVFWAATAVAVALAGPRDLLRRPVVWAAALVAGLSTTGSLLWQARHGWPQLDEGPAITADVTALGGRATFLPGLAAALGIVGVVLFCWAPGGCCDTADRTAAWGG